MGHQSRVEAKAALERRYKQVRITDIRSVGDLDAVVARRPDLAFLGMKFIYDNSKPQPKPVWVSECLSAAGIAYTGSDETALMLEHNKLLSKQIVAEQGLKTAEFTLIKHGEAFSRDDIKIAYPIFVKPVDGGGGSGINDQSRVENFDELKTQIDWLFSTYKTDALLETYLPGREFSVGIIKKRFSDELQLLPLEIVVPVNQAGSRFLSSRIKRTDSEKILEVSDLSIRHKINQLALGVFEALGAKDYGRIDIRLDDKGEPHFLEANLLPSLLDNYGNLPKAAWLNLGLSHNQLIHKIAELGFAKSAKLQSRFAQLHSSGVSF